jgi:hypothetical protein
MVHPPVPFLALSLSFHELAGVDAGASLRSVPGHAFGQVHKGLSQSDSLI